MNKKARDLVEGDIIDLEEALKRHAGFTDETLSHDVSSFEYALVESVDDFGIFTVVYTDQHNLSLPSFFEFVIQERTVSDIIEAVVGSVEKNTNIGGK